MDVYFSIDQYPINITFIKPGFSVVGAKFMSSRRTNVTFNPL